MSPGDVVVDRFVIEHHAGSGASGRVYRARDKQTGEFVALKVLHASDMEGKAERFAREARVLSELHHPGIVRYVQHGLTVDGEGFLAMEWLEGQTLRERLQKRELSLKEAVQVGRCVAGALGALHGAGFVHRDLKPANLFLCSGDTLAVKVIDFGIARLRGATAEITHTGIMLGTPGYMAPEQARGEPDVDPRADVFALGCVLFRCLTGKSAFEGDDALAVLLKVALEEAPRVKTLRPSVPEALDALVARMLSKSREERPINGNAVLHELEKLGVIDEDEPARAEEAPPSITSTERRVVGLIVARLERPLGLSIDAAEDLHGEGLRMIAGEYGGKLDLLADGSLLLAFTSERAATDLAARAARCALAVREETRPSAMALVAGREVLLSGIPMGEVIDRAVRLLAQASVAEGAFSEARAAQSPAPPKLPIPIDEVIAGLLDARFDIGAEGGLLVLRGERDVSDVGRTLLGRSTPCVGRDRELSLLYALHRETVSEGIARAVLVTGPAGIGKSRLRFEIVRRIQAEGGPVQVWFGRGDPMSAGAPFAMLGQAIRRAAGVLEGEPRAVRWQRLHARLARHLSGASLERIAELIGELSGIAKISERGSRPSIARRDPVLLGDRMRRAWEDWLAAECNAEPVVLVLEDLHWGDLPTVKFVDAALRNLPDSRLFVLAFGRPEVSSVFPRLWAERRITELRLEELTRRSSEALVRGVLGNSIDADSLNKLVERAAGNALYLEELIRAVAAGKSDALPESVLAMMQARLEELDAESRRLLRAASVFGQAFWEGGVIALLGGKRTPAMGASLATLVDLEFIFRRGESRFPGEVEYSFRHGLVREAAYGMLTDEDRVLAHRVAGQWLEAHEDVDAATLAEHYERGQEPERARGWYARAAEQALGGNDLALVIEAAEHGIRCGAKGEEFALLRMLEAEAHQWRGEHAEVARCSTDALGAVPRGTSIWYRAVAEAARVAGRLGAHTQLEALAHSLAETPADPSVLPEYVTALAQASQQLMFGGRHALAAPLLDRAERLVRVVEGDPLLIGQMSAARGVRAMCAGDLVGDLKACEAAVIAYEQGGDFRGSCHSLINVGYTYYVLGQHELAVSQLERALAMAERTGTFVLIAFAKHNLGIALARLGDLERAAAIEREAAAAALGQGDVRLETATRVYLAIILAEMNDLTGAAEEAGNAVTIAAAGTPMMAYSLAALSSVAARLGRRSEAREHAEAAYRLVTSLGSIDDGDTFVRLVFAETALMRGDRASARRAILLARERLIERASRISVDEWRQSFLTRVPENARTLHLAGELEEG
ncbi:MAG: protein kinase [Polyangiaceae bacterium]|nr:protein kinase [Polyangiaceae bacterium]